MTKLINRPLAHLIAFDLGTLIASFEKEHGRNLNAFVASWEYQEWVWAIQRTHFNSEFHEGFRDLTQDILDYTYQQWQEQARGNRCEWNGRIQ
jgi:hypothetical protein